ncbi:GNAT family N-acetyltransferase [Mycolicibacterium komossense]|uniref:GNAT family N-acetyltransferase n=1 Tax=Mycolicibacterium komossense TaxID=1779 RepID=A0ABT3CA91_9MYCO|nr:GNAT family N-acetyltransferase [Mycolicibacterium komossense]MCV7226355.1 GNAT family N-acetyltransferase [Mycolicibacterium komossense]
MADTCLRRADATDLPAITDLVNAAYTKYVERIGRPPAPMTADYAQLLQSSRIWVIDRGTTLVGLLVTENKGDHLFLDVIAVAPATQGSGYGRQLMDRAEFDAAEQGLTEVRLYTNQAMTENLTFYPKLGYQETARGSQDGFRRVFYRKVLNPG